MIKRYLVVIVLCLGGIFLAWRMLPQEREVALMHMKDKDYNAALEGYELQKDAGDLSVETAAQLAKLYVQQGSVSRAIDVLEEFVMTNPDNIEAREQLGKYYQYAQRSDDYVRNLEELAEIKPDVKYIRELSHIYNYNSQYSRQMEVLSKLVDRDPASFEDRISLARLQASSGKVGMAVDTMERLYEQMPKRMSIQDKVFFLTLLLDSDRMDKAFDLANSWVEQNGDAEGMQRAVDFAEAISAAGEPKRALDMLLRFEDRINEAPGLLVAIIKLERQLGDNKSAYERLETAQALKKDQPLPQEVRLDFLELSLLFDNPEMALGLLDGVNVEVLSPASLLGLMNTALEKRNDPFNEKLLERISPAYLANHEELALAVALLKRDRDAVLRMTSKAKYDEYSPLMRTRLAELLAKTGYTEQAFAALQAFDPTEKENDAYLVTLARLYAETGRPKTGLRFFERVLELRPTYSAEYGHVLLLAANGRAQAVQNWLNDEANPVSDQLYSDIYFTAYKRKHYGIALMAAEHLYQKRVSDERRLAYANALLQNQRALEALNILKEVSVQNRDWRAAHLAALTKVVQNGEVKGEAYSEARKELAALLDAEFNAPGVPQSQREAMLYTLLDMHAYQAALPELLKLARTEPEKWGGSYIEHANRAGETAAVVAYIQEMLNKPGLTPVLQQQFVYAYLDAKGNAETILPHVTRLARERGGDWLYLAEKLLQERGQKKALLTLLRERADQPSLQPEELRYLGYMLEQKGDRRRASVLFYRLAESRSATPKDIEQLLYLWGKNPPVGAQEWVMNRALQANSPTMVATCVEYLANLQAYDEVIAIVQGHEVSMQENVRIKDAYMTALAETGANEQLRTMLTHEVEREVQPERLMALSDKATVAGFYTLAKSGYLRVLEAKPDDALALFRLGELAYYAGAYSEADRFYAALLSSQDASIPAAHRYTANLQRGMIAQRRGQQQEADGYLETALAILQAQPEKTRQMQLAEARALYNLGRKQAAELVYEQLRRQYPADRDVAADYAEMLVAERRYSAANHVLQHIADSQPVALAAADQGTLVSDASQRLRIELLGAQLLYERGNVRASALHYEALRKENPESIYPVLALADIQSSLGNWRSSFELLDNAEAMAPYNEEIEETRRRLRSQHRSSAKVDVEYRTVQNAEDAVRTTVEAEYIRENQDKVGMRYVLDNLQADNVVAQSNGTFGNFNSERQMVELYYEHQTASGNWWHAGLLAADSGPGLNLTFTMPDYDGHSVLGAEYHMPYWDIVQGAIYDAARDRVWIGRNHRINPRTTANLAGSLNRYTIEGDDHVADSGSLQLTLARRLSDTLGDAKIRSTLQYTLDAEYMIDDAQTRTLGGTTFTPLPLRSREVHSLGINLADGDFTDAVEWEVYGGYAVDRLGGSGPFFGGALRYEITRALLGELRYSYSYDNNTFGGDVNRLGGFLKWYF